MKTELNGKSFIKLLLILMCSCLFFAATGWKPSEASADPDVNPIAVTQGASVRITDDGYSGIRFTATVSESYLDSLGGYEGMGILVIPTELLGGNELTVNTENVGDVPAVVFANGETGYKTFNAVIYDIPVSDYGTELSARAYVKQTNGNYAYSDEELTVRRSVAQAASLALKDGLNDSMLYSYVDNALVSFAVDKTAVELVKGDATVVTATVNPSNLAVVWNSGDESVATVNDGVITAVGVGTAEVTARVGSTVKTVTVTVGETIYGDNYSILIGGAQNASYVKITDGVNTGKYYLDFDTSNGFNGNAALVIDGTGLAANTPYDITIGVEVDSENGYIEKTSNEFVINYTGEIRFSVTTDGNGAFHKEWQTIHNGCAYIKFVSFDSQMNLGSIYGEGIEFIAGAADGVEMKKWTEGENAGYSRFFVTVNSSKNGALVIRASAEAGLLANTAYTVEVTAQADVGVGYIVNASEFSGEQVIGATEGTLTFNVTTDANGCFEIATTTYYNGCAWIDFTGITITEAV